MLQPVLRKGSETNRVNPGSGWVQACRDGKEDTHQTRCQKKTHPTVCPACGIETGSRLDDWVQTWVRLGSGLSREAGNKPGVQSVQGAGSQSREATSAVRIDRS